MPLPTDEQMRSLFPGCSQEWWDMFKALKVTIPGGVELVTYLEPANYEDCELTDDAE